MDTRTTLLAALPLVLIIVVLGAVLVLSSNPSFRLDIRPKASEPLPTYSIVNPYAPTGLTPATIQLNTEVACSDLYTPVCGEDNITYNSTCEATKVGATIAYYSACITSPRPTSSSLPSAF